MRKQILVFGRYAALLLAVATTLLALRPATDDGDALGQVLAQLAAYGQQYPYEKAYLHTDRRAYLPGETMWLKGYLFYGNTRTVDSASGAIFVDLVGPNGRKILLDTRLRSKAGYAEGYLTLPDTLSTGRYTLRAYTSWMRNFSEEFYHNQPIDVFKPDAPPAERTGNASLPPDVQFMPEGGRWVAGLPARMAFKALSKSGVGMDVEGFVLNDKKDTVMGYSSQHLGMGYFSLTPEAGQSYTAFARAPGATAYTSYTLPAVQATGYTIQVDNLSNKDNIRVFVSHNIPTPPDAATLASPGSTSAPAAVMPKLSLLAQMNGVPVHAVQAPASRNRFMVLIPRSKCVEGIVHITLFDPVGRPVAERLVYSAKNETINVAVAPAKPKTTVRQRVDLGVTTTDAEGKPIPANLSLAVTDTKQQPAERPYGPSLMSYLLLTSDLTGYVEQPGYYFDQKNKDRFTKLDVLLMTQGWRRFTWDKVMAKTFQPTRFFVDPGLTLSGTVFMGTSRMPVNGVSLTVMLTRKDSTRDMLSMVSDEQGRFFLQGVDLVDTNTVFVQAMRGQSRNFNVVLDKLFSPQVRLVRPPAVPLDIAYAELAELLKRQKEYLEIERQIRANREFQLQAVVVKAKRADPYSSQRSMYGTPDNTLVVDDIVAAGQSSVFDLIRRLPGVLVSGGGATPSVTVRGSAPMFMIDGMRSDAQAVASISPQTVANIDVVKGAGASIMGASSVINVITKRGGGASNNQNLAAIKSPGVIVEKVVGYAPKREFYAPRYDAPTPEERYRPDYRATLHWAPLIQTDATGKATTSFYTSDAKTTLRIVVNGTTASGYPGYTETTMKVE
ncbi:TonB-dependent receptor plug domain-containing protein [Fibrella aquatilis]|uniref:TonB-dependent receptor plug domain-containing protein n=1 Tax=Fibrella aquatilis TaxID=2817059 RepID=A0A939K1B4_9BACT|nr:TonB-dependent receptor plug domain-containing protein [Fibrella aquatilis]MBO0932095.1 TonB-dependent receptor plug domain-containing protein [Fibrella aquatilis]